VPEIKAIAAHRFLVETKKRYALDYGGRGSGKSVAASQALIELALKRKGRVLAVRKVARTLRLSVFPRLIAELSEWGLLSRCAINKTEMTITLPNGSEINCIGLDDPEKIKSLEKPWLAWVEEADSLTPSDFDAVDFVLRQGDDKIIMTFNPPPLTVGSTHWIKDRFIDRKDEQAIVKKTTWHDNPFLPETYIARLNQLKETNTDLYRMWALGEFVGLSGAIFDNWQIVDAIPDDAEFVGYGLDFGFSIDPAALIASYRYNGEYYHREIIYQTGLNNRELARAMEESGVDKGVEIVADSSEPKSIDELRASGFFISPAVKGPDSVRAGIDYLRGFRHNVEVNSSGLIKEFGSYCWRVGKDGKPRPQPIDAFNHGIDAIRYNCYRAQPAQFFIGRA
jgi:phage terminase large subunit